MTRRTDSVWPSPRITPLPAREACFCGEAIPVASWRTCSEYCARVLEREKERLVAP